MGYMACFFVIVLGIYVKAGVAGLFLGSRHGAFWAAIGLLCGLFLGHLYARLVTYALVALIRWKPGIPECAHCQTRMSHVYLSGDVWLLQCAAGHRFLMTLFDSVTEIDSQGNEVEFLRFKCDGWLPEWRRCNDR